MTIKAPENLRATNTSGFPGVSWSKAAGKWSAFIRRDGKRKYLGLFPTAEAAAEAYRSADQEAALRTPAPPDPLVEVLTTVRQLYEEHGIEALSTRFQPMSAPYSRARLLGLSLTDLAARIGVLEEHQAWRNSTRKYRGSIKPKWTWDVAVAEASKVKEMAGDLPTLQWFRSNGHSSLANVVFTSGHTWEDLRAAVGCFATSSFVQSRNGMRWLSHPEASLSNFLYARGIDHRKGERYADEYAEESGRNFGRYDLHFHDRAGTQIDVEIWGNLPDNMVNGRYSETRALKEAFQEGRADFLGIDYDDCFSDKKLSTILEPFVGQIDPYIFDGPADPFLETSHWSNADELLETCRHFAKTMPDGVFPGDSWLRKRGRYGERAGPAYNTLSQMVNRWLGGTRSVRKLLGQESASTTAWTKEQLIDAWAAFEDEHGLSPSQLSSDTHRERFPQSVYRDARKIYAAAARHGVLEAARAGKNPRVKWTPEVAAMAWRDFVRQHGELPTYFMSAAKRRDLPRQLTDEATRIYGAVQRLGLLDSLKRDRAG